MSPNSWPTLLEANRPDLFRERRGRPGAEQSSSRVPDSPEPRLAGVYHVPGRRTLLRAHKLLNRAAISTEVGHAPV